MIVKTEMTYETEMQIWALELSLLLRQTKSKCERNCKCCTDLTSLVPTSFVTNSDTQMEGTTRTSGSNKATSEHCASNYKTAAGTKNR